MAKKTKKLKRSKDEAVKQLIEIRKLMMLCDENPFKTRAFERAIDIVAGSDEIEERARAGTLTELAGIGKGIESVLEEFFFEGTCSLAGELREELPEGLEELVRVPGLGPKRARQLIEKLDLRSLAELEYACRENRLAQLKGFSDKAQKTIFENIQFVKSQSHLARLVDLERESEDLLGELKEDVPGLRVEVSGALRRKLELLDGVDLLVSEEKVSEVEALAQDYARRTGLSVPIRVHGAAEANWGSRLLETTGPAKHVRAVSKKANGVFGNEEEIYSAAGTQWIDPVLRDSVDLKIPNVLGENEIKGVFHVHTDWSDGSASAEKMIHAASEMGYQYIGFSDHSRSAVYANGLNATRLKEQLREIQVLREKYPQIRIFWGIESDILKDGSLDYPESVLKKFDFVIASIHTRYKNNKKEMTQRILKAIRNPATRFLGHLTGRLLLGRDGYDLDMERIFEEATKKNVAIEINASPARMEVDWRWGKLLRKHKTMTSVHPDAHSIEGLKDTRFGVIIARKSLLSSAQVLNTRSADEVEAWLARK